MKRRVKRRSGRQEGAKASFETATAKVPRGAAAQIIAALIEYRNFLKLNKYAGMAELADALDSGSSEGNFMQVQVLLPAP